MQRTIHLETVLAHPPVLVWRALTEPELLGRWFMANDIAPQLHHAFTFRMAPQRGWDGITHCQVTAVETERRLAYTYRGEATGEKALACAGVHAERAAEMTKGIFTRLDTEVSFSIAPTCGGTILTLDHAGFRGLKLVVISFIMQRGWRAKLRGPLPRLLATIAPPA